MRAMRLLVTADLHYNHGRSRLLAEELIDQMNDSAARSTAAGQSVGVLVVGDTAAADGDDLERCLSRFRVDGPKLFVAGNHELWTHRADSHALFEGELPTRVRAIGWHWLEGEPVVFPGDGGADEGGGVAVVGSVGWYDYSFALPLLGIPRRFYAHKVSPAAATRFAEFAHLLERTDDISPAGMDVAARWNDGRHVKLHRTDEQFLAERLAVLAADLDRLETRQDVRAIVVGVHHVPFAELMPPKPQFVSSRAFAGGFLGSPAIGELLLRYPKVRRVYCGHSHLAAEAPVGHLRAVNIGSGYRSKTFVEVDTASV